MNAMTREKVLAAIANRESTGRYSRRHVLRMAGSVGLAAAAGVALGRRASAGFLQEGSPAAVATPTLGERADGTRLWRVKVGGMDMENKLDLQAFFPGEITINVGDSIWFERGMMPGFHTVTFLSGSEPLPLYIPDPDAGTPAAGELPKLIYNPDFLFPLGGETYDGTGVVNAGVDILADPTKPFVLTFTAPGTFDYLCIPHGAVMQARVIVQEAGSELPYDQAAYDQMGADQVAALIDEGMAEWAKYAEPNATTRDDGTTLWEAAAGAGPNQARVMAFLPESLNVTVGDTVKWVIQSTNEPHTVTFVGAGETPPEDTIIEPQPAGPPKIVQNMLTFLPQGGNVWSGAGFVNSGFLGIPALGLPVEFELTFDTPGEYIYYCILHGDAAGEGMAAKITVGAG